MRLLTLNSTNKLPESAGNVFRLQFPSPYTFVSGDYIALKRLSMFNSVYSIKAEYNNNMFGYRYPNGAGYVTRTVVIPDGTYTVAQLNAVLQNNLVLNNHYLIDDNGNYRYYIRFIENAIRYAVQIDCTPLPTILPPLWTNPGLALPVASVCPSVEILTNNFTKIIGINSGLYPPLFTATATSTLSQFTPQLSPIFGTIVTCSLINNKYANPTTSFNSFPFTVPYGDLLDFDPHRMIFTDIVPGTYTGVDIALLDNDKQPLQIVDDNLLIQLVLWIGELDGDVSEYYQKAGKRN